MRRFLLPCLLGLSLCLSAGTPLAFAQKEKKDDVYFETIDGVEIQGTFWPPQGKPGRKAPCAILLHKIGGKSGEAGWTKLAEELQKEGFAVLAFDFRGHGGSLSVGQIFWNSPFNRQFVRGFRRGSAKQPSKIDYKDFSPTYLPFLVNDLAAARIFLEKKNDAGECNISTTVLIGAEDGATLGALWLASECHRKRALPRAAFAPLQFARSAESKDVVACVWLNMKKYLGPDRRGYNVASALVGWLREAGKEQKIPMAFVHGKKDLKGDGIALELIKYIKPTYNPKAKPDTQDEPKETIVHAVDDTNLVGSDLLKVKDTSKKLAGNYLGNVLKNNRTGQWEDRETTKAGFYWVFGNRPLPAKGEGERQQLPIPLNQFGLR